MEYREIVINESRVIKQRIGRFSLSNKAIERYLELKGKTWETKKGYCVPDCYYVDGEIFDADGICRDDETLIQIVKELKGESNGELAFLKIVKIPSDVKWRIVECDGDEYVAEVHRTWY